MEQTIIILCLACISIIRLLNQLEGRSAGVCFFHNDEDATPPLGLEIDFGPSTTETKNIKDYVNFDIGGLF